MNDTHTLRRSRQAGSVLILALWVVFFLAALTLAIGAHVAAILGAASRLGDRAQAELQGAGAAAYAAALIMAQTNTWDGVQPDAWNRDPSLFRQVQLGDLYFSIGFDYPVNGVLRYHDGLLGEESRVNLNLASVQRMSLLFEQLGVAGRLPPETLAIAIVQRRGDESERLTETAGNGYDFEQNGESQSIGESLRSVDALLLIDGVDDALLETLRPYVTVYGSTRNANINAVPEPVLLSLARYVAGDDVRMQAAAAPLVRKIMQFRSDGHAFEKADGGASMQAVLEQHGLTLEGSEIGLFRRLVNRMDVKSSLFRATVRVLEGNHVGGDERPLGQLEFVWDSRLRQYVMWRER